MRQLQTINDKNNILHTVCNEVVDFVQAKSIVENLFDVMYFNGGIGIAAPQIGIDQRIIIADSSFGEISTECRVMINPKIISSSSIKEESTEGCLSLPDQLYTLKRSSQINVQWQNLNGEIIQEKFNNLMSRIIQHEIEHLNGIILSDIARRATFRVNEDQKRTA